MIQKRYQFYYKEDIKWTDWFNYESDNTQVSKLKKEEKYQLKPCLLSDFRIV